MEIMDTHCDALLKLTEDTSRSFTNNSDIQTNYHHLQAGNVKLQFFAIFIEPEVKQNHKFDHVLDQVHAFYEKVLKPNPRMKHIRQWQDMFDLKEGEIGAVLALEGLDAIGNDLIKMSILTQLGVLSVGLTWNFANLFADGVKEARGAGLTELGKEMVLEFNKKGILTDVSHISEKGFWDVMERAEFPIASHSNAKAICNSPRNLTDEQIKALILKGGYMGLVLYPEFLTGTKQAAIKDLASHIEHICSLGGENLIGIGSDFDGIDCFITDVEHSGKLPFLLQELTKFFPVELIEKIAHQNFKAFIQRKFI